MGNARKTVLRLLTRLENSGSYSNILLDEGLERSDLSPQDKKFAAALFYGVLERQITLDNIIREYSRNPKNKLGTEVRVILRWVFISFYIWTPFLTMRLWTSL